jgi:hypothetical protein
VHATALHVIGFEPEKLRANHVVAFTLLHFDRGIQVFGCSVICCWSGWL